MPNIFTTVYTVPDNIFKMPRKTLFSVAWLSQTDSNGQRIGEWCTKGSDGYSGDCKNKLLDQALKVQDGTCQKRKAEGEEKPAKKKGGIGKHQVKGESVG